MKLCCKCKTTKPFEDFYKNKVMKDGYHSFCIICHKVNNAALKKLKRSDPVFRAKELAYKKEYRARNVEQRKTYMKEWHAKNSVQQITYREQYRLNNPTYFQEYAKANKHKVNASTRKRQAAKLQRTPAWLTDIDYWMIEEAYELAALRTKIFGFSWEVDHVLPLQGKVISGLHTPYNLQVIPMVKNRSKANKLEI
jgi:hypothetical protein